MKCSLQSISLLAVCVFCVPTCLPQSVENLTSVFKDGNATITYDLVGFRAKELYIVDLYSSHNNFLRPLKMVSGDVGKNIAEGTGKRIEWKASQEAPGYT